MTWSFPLLPVSGFYGLVQAPSASCALPAAAQRSWRFRGREGETVHRRTMTALGLLSRAAQGGTARYAGR